MKHTVSNIPIEERTVTANVAKAFWYGCSKRKTPDFLVVGTVVYVASSLRPSSIVSVFSRQKKDGKQFQRLVLSRHQWEELCEKIDSQFTALNKEQPDLKKYQIYRVIADKSKECLGVQLRPRQVEGKQAAYLEFLRKRRNREDGIR